MAPARSCAGIAPPAGIDRDTLERVTEKARVVALLRGSAEHVRHVVAGCPRRNSSARRTLYGRRVPQWTVLFHQIAH
jgi:hypothetical protein